MKVEVNFKNLEGDGFAGFLKDSVRETGTAQVVVDINAMLNCSVDNKDITFKQLFSESVVHEMLHSIEELFDQAFDENRVEEAIMRARDEL